MSEQQVMEAEQDVEVAAPAALTDSADSGVDQDVEVAAPAALTDSADSGVEQDVEVAAPVALTDSADSGVEQDVEVAAPAALTDSTDSGVDQDGRVVKILSVGQQVQGTVKRITEFGAFIDIGVGRDGLVHISELSVSRVGKVGDVLTVGQEVTLWIKKLDRDRNRISLTLIEPGRRTVRDLQKGEVVEGTVTRILPYGAFVDIGVGRDALVACARDGRRLCCQA